MMPRRAAEQVVPTLAETSADFIGPLNPHVGTLRMIEATPHTREAFALGFIIGAVAALAAVAIIIEVWLP